MSEPTYTRAELDAALRVGEGTALGEHLAVLFAKNKHMRADEIAARVLADHIRRVELDVRRDWMEARDDGREGTLVACENLLQYIRGEDMP